MTDDDVRARLLPCPFCGSDKAAVLRVANIGYAVSCNGCGASSEIGPPAGLAAAKWNRRAAHADLSGEVRELVEADREYDAAEAGLSRNADGPLTKRLARFNEAGKRRSIALAKFTQEKP